MKRYLLCPCAPKGRRPPNLRNKNISLELILAQSQMEKGSMCHKYLKDEVKTVFFLCIKWGAFSIHKDYVKSQLIGYP